MPRDADANYSPPPEEIDEEDEAGPSTRAQKRATGNQQQTWEVNGIRSWDDLDEDGEGGLQAAVQQLLARGRRKRALQSETPLRRSIIRHMFIILDLSDTMRDKDFRPTRWEVTLGYLRSYVTEWFDQNPLGQVGIILLRDRLSEVLVPMGGNPQEIIAALADKRRLEEAYGQRGVPRWDLIDALDKSSLPRNQNDRPTAHLLTANRPDLPLCLQPLRPTPLPPSEKTPRARTHHPPNEGQRKARIAWNRDRLEVKPPIAIPSDGPKTGWEGLGVMESLRVLAGFHETLILHSRRSAGVDEGDIPESGKVIVRQHQLSSFEHLPKRMKAFFPIKLVPTLREEPYPIPPPQHRRQTPGRWQRARRLDERLVRRMYQRLFMGLNWVIPNNLNVMDAGKMLGGWKDVEWKRCSYEEMKAWESGETVGKGDKRATEADYTKWSMASEREIHMVREMAAA